MFAEAADAMPVFKASKGEKALNLPEEQKLSNKSLANFSSSLRPQLSPGHTKLSGKAYIDLDCLATH